MVVVAEASGPRDEKRLGAPLRDPTLPKITREQQHANGPRDPSILCTCPPRRGREATVRGETSCPVSVGPSRVYRGSLCSAS